MRFLRWIWGLILAVGAIAGLLILGQRDREASGRNQAAAGKAKRRTEEAADEANELNRDADAREREAADIREAAEKDLNRDKSNETGADILDRWKRRGMRRPSR